MNRVLSVAAVASAVVLMLSGCSEPTKVTGGGYIPSAAEDGKANFGFNGNSCNGTVVGHFNYHDKNADDLGGIIGGQPGGVKVNGDVVNAVECLDVLDPNTEFAPEFCSTVCAPNVGLPALGVEVNYDSRNPKAPGSGTAYACVTDNGEGANATSADMAAIVVASGPHAGYSNFGPVQGNIQEHGCRR